MTKNDAIIELLAWPKVSQITSTGYTGGGKAHSNMPPYLTVYMWKRTA